MPRGKQRSHWIGVLDRRHHQRVSRISANEDKRMPAKITAEVIDINRLWITGIGPRGIPLLHRIKERKRWRREAAARYKAIDVKRKDQVEPQDWAWLHRNPTIAGCSER